MPGEHLLLSVHSRAPHLMCGVLVGERNFSPTAVQGANGAEQHFQTFDSSDLCACAGDSIITMYERATAQICLQLEEITQ